MPKRIIEGNQSLEELIGKEIGVSDWVTITQPMIDEFAELTKDWQWIHVDTERAAKESPFQSTVAHGFMTMSLLSHFLETTIHTKLGHKLSINYGFNRLRFTAPVPAQSRIRARFVLQSLEEIKGGTQITWNVSVERENSEKPVLVAEWLARKYM